MPRPGGRTGVVGRAAAATWRDVRQGHGVAAHAGWCALGATLGTGLLRAGSGAAWFAGTASSVALVLQLAVPGALLVTLVGSALAQVMEGGQQNALGVAPIVAPDEPPDPLAARAAGILTAGLGLAVGLGLAPLAAGAAGIPVAAAIASCVGGGLALGTRAAWAKGIWRPGFDLPTVACLTGATATAPLTWSLLAGTTAGAAVGTALAVACLGLGWLMVHAYLWRGDGQAQFTPYADNHRVAPAAVQEHRADCLGEPSPTVFNVPPALVTRLQQLRSAQRRDAEGRAYFLGTPVLLLDGPPGSGKTSMVHAVAQKLDAELLRASAGTLGRVTIAGHPTALVRLMTLIGQAELRALRTGRLHVVFVDEAAALFGREVDLASAEGLTRLQGLAMLTLQLTLQNPRRNGVVLVFADAQLAACRDTLLALTPQPLTTLGRPTAAQLGQIYDHALQQALADHAQTYGVRVVEPAAQHGALRALRPQVQALAERGAWGRDAATVVGRMARAGEAVHAVTAGEPGRVLDAMAAAGRRALERANDELAARPAVVAPAAAPAAAPDAEVLDAAVRQLMSGGLVDDPAGAIGGWLTGQAGRNMSPLQYVDYQNIQGSYAGTYQQIIARTQRDVDTLPPYLLALIRAAQERGPGDDPLTRGAGDLLEAVAPPAPPADFFADVTLLHSMHWLSLMLGRRTRPRTQDGVEPYAVYSARQQLYVMLRQRQDGQRRDHYRSELGML